MRLLFISFFDSFEQNIISKLSLDFKVEKISYREIEGIKLDDFDCYCLGPGPGHVNEYQDACSHFIQEIFNSKAPILGICLGHQLVLATLYDGKIVKSSKPIHGQSVELKDESLSLVSRYNSWTVKLSENLLNFCTLDEYGEIAYFRKNQILTMQFHPESVGTSCPEKFFEMIRDFVLHNIRDERS